MNAEGFRGLDELRSSSPSQRATAAGWLLRHPHEINTHDLMQALQAENIPRIRRVLLQVLDARQTSESSGPDNSAVNSEGVRTPSSGALEQMDVAALIKHELSPPIGWIRAAANDEINDFALSKTNQAICKLQRRLNGLMATIKSREDLNLRYISLPQLIIENWPDCHTEPHLSPLPEEVDIDIETDEGLFSIILSNAFQNAIDASIEATGSPSVQISWGHTAEEYWIRVANPFKGDRISLSDVSRVGRTTKQTHQGQGMAVIKLVAARLGIKFALEGHSGVASFVMSGARSGD